MSTNIRPNHISAFEALTSGTPQQDFTCLACNCPAQDSYHVIAVHDEEGDHKLRDVTAEIHAVLGRRAG